MYDDFSGDVKLLQGQIACWFCTNCFALLHSHEHYLPQQFFWLSNFRVAPWQWGFCLLRPIMRDDENCCVDAYWRKLNPPFWTELSVLMPGASFLLCIPWSIGVIEINQDIVPMDPLQCSSRWPLSILARSCAKSALTGSFFIIGRSSFLQSSTFIRFFIAHNFLWVGASPARISDQQQ